MKLDQLVLVILTVLVVTFAPAGRQLFERLRYWWALRSVPRRGLAPQGWVRGVDGKPHPFAADESPEQDIATEGLGAERPVPAWLWGRRVDGRSFVRRAWPSWTTPLAYLPEPEWRLWTDVLAESAR